MKNLFFSGVLLLLAACIFTGCSESDERRHPLYIKALQDRENGNGKAAAEKLCELLKRRPRSIYTHKLLAAVYDEMLNEPAKAVYHYQAYLQAMPEAADAEEVNAWLLQAEKRCYNQLKQRFEKADTLPETAVTEKAPAPAEVADTAAAASEKAPETADKPEKIAQNDELSAAKAAQIAQLQQELAQYRNRYYAIRSEVEKLRKLRKNPAQPAAAAVTTGNASTLRQYKVVNGDTFGSIARKVYGKSSLYPIILQANPQADARKLRPGMVLNIPEINKKPTQGAAR